MKMMTKELEREVPRLGEQDGKGYMATMYAHYFCTFNGWHYYMTEYDPETKTAFGLVDGFEREFGYFSIEEFERINSEYGFAMIERDLYFRKGTLAALYGVVMCDENDIPRVRII